MHAMSRTRCSQDPRRAAATLVAGALICGPASAAAFTFDDTISVEAASTREPTPSKTSVHRRFGEKNSLRFNVLAGAASNFSDTELAQAGVGLSWFAIDWFSVELELLGMGVFQEVGKDAAGADLNVLFRWHFWRSADERVTVFADAGIGFSLFSQEVPDGGSNFNFAPQAGVGASFDLGGDVRLLAGLRWLHLSNARTTETNNGLDTLLAYCGVSLGF